MSATDRTPFRRRRCRVLSALILAALVLLAIVPALASAGGRTVVITRAGWLAREYGQSEASRLNARMKKIGTVVELPADVSSAEDALDYVRGALAKVGVQLKSVRAIQIVGGPDAVPYFSVPFDRPRDGDKQVLTDDLYGDRDGDGFLEAPVARLPDGNSLELLETQLLEPRAGSREGAFLLSMEQNLRVKEAKAVQGAIGYQSTLVKSPPIDYDVGKAAGYSLEHDMTFFIVHGASDDASHYWGQPDGWSLHPQPIAFRAEDASSNGVVYSGACYGAKIESDSTPDTSIALAFLKSGARCFVGSTESSYTSVWSGGKPDGGTLMSVTFFSEVARSDDPMAAFVVAKETTEVNGVYWGPSSTSTKAAHEYVYYGVLPKAYWTGSSGAIGPAVGGGAATSLVIDVSGTMSNEYQGEIKLTQAKNAANDVAGVIAGYGNMTKTGAQVAVSSFSNGAATVQPLTSDVDAIRASVDALQTEDMTNVGAGIADGIAQLDAAKSGAEKVMILLSDGLNNEGMTNEEVLAGPVEEARQKDVKIFTVGFGDVGDLDPDFLQQIADLTGGEYALADATTIANSVAGKFVLAQIEATQKILAENEGTVAQGETTKAGTFAVPTTSGDVQAVLLWPGSTLRLDLTDPTGVKVGPGYPGYKQSTGDGPAQIVVQGARAGTWTSSVYGEQVSMAEEPFYSIVSFKKVKRAAVTSGGGGMNNSGGGIIIGVILAIAGVGVVWLVVAALRQRPAGAGIAVGGEETGLLGVAGGLGGPTAVVVGEHGERYPLRAGPNTVGRDVGNDVELVEPSVSRRHAVLTVTSVGIEVRDLRSTVGVFVNGERVAFASVRDGDEVRFGEVRLRVTDSSMG